MAGSCTYCNFSSSDGKDKLAGRVPIEVSSTFTPILAAFQALNLTFAPVIASAPIFRSALGLPDRYKDKNLQKATKLVLNTFVRHQKHGQANFGS